MISSFSSTFAKLNTQALGIWCCEFFSIFFTTYTITYKVTFENITNNFTLGYKHAFNNYSHTFIMFSLCRRLILIKTKKNPSEKYSHIVTLPLLLHLFLVQEYRFNKKKIALCITL